MNTTLRTALLSLSALALVATACGDDDDSQTDVSVADPWVREPAAGTSATAAYAVLTNEGDEAVTLVAATSDLTDSVELHVTLVDDEGTMSMQEQEEGFVIEAGGSLVMEPGGPHVMLLDVDPADVTGEIEVTYEFDGADDVTVQAPVEALPTGEMGDMDGMDEMDSTDGTEHSEDMESETTDG